MAPLFGLFRSLGSLPLTRVAFPERQGRFNASERPVRHFIPSEGQDALKRLLARFRIYC